MEKKDYSHIPLILGLIFSVTAFILDFIAFFSPYWLECVSPNDCQFRNLGLWVACFDRFTQPEDYVSKEYSGCWFVYYPEYNYIRAWLNPGWFYAVQMLSLVALFSNLYAVITVGGKFCKIVPKQQKKTDLGSIIAQFLAGCSYIVISVIMGYESKDREWMPRYDHNQLTWGFALAVLAGFFSIFAFIVLCCHYMIAHWPHGPRGAKDKPDHKGYQLARQTDPSAITSGATTSAKHREALLESMSSPPGSRIGGSVPRMAAMSKQSLVSSIPGRSQGARSLGGLSYADSNV